MGKRISHKKNQDHDTQRRTPDTDAAFFVSLQSVLEPLEDYARGSMDGTVSGEIWKAFLNDMRTEILEKLNVYRALRSPLEFCPASMGTYKDDLQKIQRDYIRDMTALYRQASTTYRNIGG